MVWRASSYTYHTARWIGVSMAADCTLMSVPAVSIKKLQMSRKPLRQARCRHVCPSSNVRVRTSRGTGGDAERFDDDDNDDDDDERGGKQHPPASDATTCSDVSGCAVACARNFSIWDVFPLYRQMLRKCSACEDVWREAAAAPPAVGLLGWFPIALKCALL